MGWHRTTVLCWSGWRVGGCPIPWQVWKELGWAGSTQEELPAAPKQREKSKQGAIFNFEKNDYLWYLPSHKLFKKQTCSKSAALWATNWSASLQQACLSDLSGFCSCCAPGPHPDSPSSPDLELGAGKVSVRGRVCWSVLPLKTELGNSWAPMALCIIAAL